MKPGDQIRRGLSAFDPAEDPVEFHRRQNDEDFRQAKIKVMRKIGQDLTKGRSKKGSAPGIKP